MAYKPPKQTIVDNDLKYAPSNEAVFEALKLKLDEPSVTGTAGQLLQLDAYVGGEPTMSWVNPPNPLPSQTGNLDKVLVTDGTNASWQFAGLGAGSLPTNTIIVGRAKPTGLTGTTNTIIGTGTTGDALTSGVNNIFVGNNTAPNAAANDNNILIGNSITVASNIAGLIQTVAIGNHITIAPGGTNPNNSVLIGFEAQSDQNSVAVGWRARANTPYSVSVGRSSQSTGEASTAVGYEATANRYGAALGFRASTNQNAIALGFESSAPTVNTMAVGSAGQQINTVYFGRGGATQTAANAVTIMTMRASGTNTNLSAGTLTLAGSQSTGNQAGGDVIIATAPAGASGSTLNAHVERMRIDSAGNAEIGLTSTTGWLSGYRLNLSNFSGTQRNLLQLRTSSGDGNHKMYLLGHALVNPGAWNNASYVLQYRVDTTDASFIRFRESSTTIGAGFNCPINSPILTINASNDGLNGTVVAMRTSSSTSTVEKVFIVNRQSSGTPAAGIGASIEMAVETASGNTETGVILEAVTTDVTAASEDFDFVVKTMTNGAAASEKLRVTASSNLKLSCGLTVKSSHAQVGTADVITVSVSDYYVGVDCSLAAKTVNLPAAATAGAGKTFVIKDETGSSATNNITIDADGAELIDGAATYVMAVNRESVTLVCDGTGWQII